MKPALAGVLGSVALSLHLGAQQPTFRSAVDLIAVDVQVMNTDGFPISALAADRFEVSINGARRRVVSASLVGSARTLEAGADRPLTPGASATNTWPADGPGRAFVVAVDSSSFEPDAWQRTALTARAFLARLDRNDQVAFYAYPFGPAIALTDDRAKVGQLLAGATSGSSTLRTAFHLTPSEVIDISTEMNRATGPATAVRRTRGGAIDTGSDVPTVQRVQDRECPNDANCSARILMDADLAAARLEARVEQGVSGLKSMLEAVALMPGRKTIVLLSGGMAVSDVPGGRPQADDVSRTLGNQLAQANAVIYTLHIDSTRRAMFSATQQRVNLAGGDPVRETALMGRWLEQFSVASGGSLLRVQTDDGEGAFERVLRESSSYYLLGVEPSVSDRDGKLRALKVSVRERGATVRHRRWVIVPKKP